MAAADERLAAFLERRKRDLTTQINALKSLIRPREVELEQVLKILISNKDYASAFATEQPAAASDTLPVYLGRRQRELRQQIAALSTKLAPLERELEDIIKAKKTVGMIGVDEANSAVAEVAEKTAGMAESATGQEALKIAADYLKLTIKDMILRALSSGHFPRGAKPSELRDFMKNAFGRDVSLQSISPQLSRLKADHKVEHKESADTWLITLAGAADAAGGGVGEPAEDRTGD